MQCVCGEATSNRLPSSKKWIFSLYFFLVPVREQEGADVGHRRGRRPKLRQRHDVFEGDVGLGAHVHHLDLLRGTVGASAGGPPDDLHHDGFLGGTEGLHSLLMAGLGQFLPVHLGAGTTITSSVVDCCHSNTFQSRAV